MYYPSRIFWYQIAFSLFAILFVSNHVFADDDKSRLFEWQIQATAEENFDYAAAQLWIPTKSVETRGILCIVLHPLAAGGSLLADPGPWISLVDHYHCALMAISFAQSRDKSKVWCKPEQGTGDALLKAVNALSKESRISNLTTAPIVIAGICAAGQFSYGFSALHPDRVSVVAAYPTALS